MYGRSGGGGKCVNETAYHHEATEAAGFPGVCDCVKNLHVCGSCGWWGDGSGVARCRVSSLIVASLVRSGHLVGWELYKPM